MLSFPPSPLIMRFEAANSGNAASGGHSYPVIFGRPPDLFGHFSEVLGGGGKQQLVLDRAQAMQSQPVELERLLINAWMNLCRGSTDCCKLHLIGCV